MASRRIRFKLIATFFFISLFSVSIIGILVFFADRSSLLSETEVSLQVIANTQSQDIQHFFSQLETRAIDFSSDGFIRESTKTLTQESNEKVKEELVQHLRNNKLPLDASLFVIEVFDLKGSLLATTGSYQAASFDVSKQILENLSPDTAVLSPYLTHESPRGLQKVLVALAPIVDKETNQRLGYIANHYFLDSLTDILRMKKTNPSFDQLLGWKTLESNLVSSGDVLIAVSDPEDENFLNKTTDLHVFGTVCGNTASVRQYISHNGKEATGIAHCVNAKNYLIVEVESQEIFTRLFETVRNMVAVAIVTVVLMTVLSLFPVRKIIYPLEELRGAVRYFGEGKGLRSFVYDKKDEIGELFQSFKQMTENIQMVEQRRRDFISIVSHQMRTPLTSIRLYMELLRNSLKRPKVVQKEFMDSIDISVDQMTHLISDLLNVSRIEAGKLRIHPVLVDLSEIIGQVLEEISPLAQQSRCTIHVTSKNPLASVVLDRDFFHQILRNLIVNAIKYSREDVCEVSLFVDEIKENKRSFLRIRVQDAGIGIKREDQAHIFEKFFRSETARKRNTEGTGLGLYVAKMILDQTGGFISFKSEEGIGTVFTVLIPKTGMSSQK
ncbi:sensor histidine kinase [Candidatus Uhrbacteria bacterium]|nr:sensor histidine kinase [Candidatus Uhrbacteria bacterium]